MYAVRIENNRLLLFNDKPELKSTTFGKPHWWSKRPFMEIDPNYLPELKIGDEPLCVDPINTNTKIFLLDLVNRVAKL